MLRTALRPVHRVKSVAYLLLIRRIVGEENLRDEDGGALPVLSPCCCKEFRYRDLFSAGLELATLSI